MKYSFITFDENTFFNARLTNNDMVFIERYIRKHPLMIFTDDIQKGDLVFIIYMSLRTTSEVTLNDIHDYVEELEDEIDLTLQDLTNIVIQIYKDMGYLDDKDKPDPVIKDSGESTSTNNSNGAEYKQKTFKQTLNGILEQYLLLGTVEEFWSSNLDEVTRQFDRYKKILRSTSESDYMLALMIASNVGVMMNGKKGDKIRSIEDFFPSLYDEVDDAEREERQRKERLIRGFSEFASNFNKNKQLKEAEEAKKQNRD